MTQENASVVQCTPKIKPKIPQKPAHLVCGDAVVNKNDKIMHPPLKTVDEKSKNDRKVSPDRNGCTYTTMSSAINNNVNHKEDFDRKSVTPQYNVTSNSIHPTEIQLETCRNSVYNDGYVEINFPRVEPGTVIRSDGKTGEFRAVASQDPQYEVCRCSRNKIAQRSVSEGGVKSKLIKHYPRDDSESAIKAQHSLKSNSVDSLFPSKCTRGQVDENGYEIPLPFRKPTYLSFDSDLGISSADETADAATPSEKPVVVSKLKKKRRLARYKRQAQPQTAALADSLSKSFILSFSGNQANVSESNLENTATSKPFAKPIDSFLSNRLRAVQSDSKLSRYFVSECSSSATSTNLTDSTSEDEWSFSSDEYSSGEECYYQQIDPPKLCENVLDHDYEDIEEWLVWSKSSKQVSRKKSVKNVMASVVSSRKRDKLTKTGETNKSPTDLGRSPKLQRHNMHDMRSKRVEECTWATVSTPGILKLHDFKDFGKDKTTSVEVTAAY
ncbi:unnamed protein product [Clavelina lepadiformis]|uniref:Uncharacterized protein n=1 Tax=Clavelina lepadiformis TaxID=159417 RepID=A0ABP0GK15_CLALP